AAVPHCAILAAWWQPFPSYEFMSKVGPLLGASAPYRQLRIPAVDFLVEVARAIRTHNPGFILFGQQFAGILLKLCAKFLIDQDIAELAVPHLAIALAQRASQHCIFCHDLFPADGPSAAE